MRWLSWLGVLLICAIVAASLAVYKYREIQGSIERGKAFPEPAEAVETYTVKAISRHPTLSVTGEVISTQSATLQNELKGRIVSVGFAPGSSVRSGQILLQLDTSQEGAQLAEARANQEITRLALERAERLVKNGAGSVENRDQTRAQFDSALARSTALMAVIAKKTLRAPFDAITSLHQLEVGQFLDAGTEITQLVGVSDHIWIDFSLPQDRAFINVGSRVEVSYNNQNTPLIAEVIAKDASINVRSRNLRMRAQLPATAATLLPGMLVNVNVPLGTSETVTIVPATAVRRDALGTSVYVLEQADENGQLKTRARRRKVEIAASQDVNSGADTLIIRTGVQPGETIAAIGAFKLRDGTLVIPSEPNLDALNRNVGR